MIPPGQSAAFVADMEHVLDYYKRLYDPKVPLVCMDESPKQLIRETRRPIAPAPGRLARHDYEYERCGVCNIFMACEPLAGRRLVEVTERKTKHDWAHFVETIAGSYADAYSEAKRTVIPREGGQPFRRKADTDSDGTRTVIPTECGHPSRDVRGFFWS